MSQVQVNFPLPWNMGAMVETRLSSLAESQQHPSVSKVNNISLGSQKNENGVTRSLRLVE